MNTQQGKALLVVITICVSSYVIRFVIDLVTQARYYHALQNAPIEPRRKKEISIPAERKLPQPVMPAPRPSKPKPGPFTGKWRGQVALSGRGVCVVNLELREKPDQPTDFTGYFSIACNGARALVSKDRAGDASATINRLDPEMALLTGSMEDGAIHFNVEKSLGADTRGCAVSSFEVTPFGTSAIAAAWKEDTCQGGHIILRRFFL